MCAVKSTAWHTNAINRTLKRDLCIQRCMYIAAQHMVHGTKRQKCKELWVDNTADGQGEQQANGKASRKDCKVSCACCRYVRSHCPPPIWDHLPHQPFRCLYKILSGEQTNELQHISACQQTTLYTCAGNYC